MKKLFFAVICILSIIGFNKISTAQKELKPSSKIEKITVFLNNAQIERSSFINLPAGNSEIIISGLSQYIDINTLRVSGKGSFVIMSQQVQIKYPEPTNQEQDVPNHVIRNIRLMSDSLELLAFDFLELNSKKEVLVNEKNFLHTSSAITKSDTITKLKDALSYYRSRMNEINHEWIKLSKTERLLLIKKKDMEERLTQLRNYSRNTSPPPVQSLPTAEISIVVVADKAVQGARIDLSYISSNVSWQPFYELRVDEVSKPVQLQMKANLIQNTGENWERAKLVFSTGQPAVYKTVPHLPVWYLNYFQPARYANESYGGAPVSQVAAKTERNENDETYVMADAYKSNQYTQVSQGLIAAEYVVSIPYTIPSDGKTTTITLLNETLVASYKYIAIPKADKDVFLTTYLTGWEKLNLVQGQANIVYQNSIISKTNINTATTMDTLIVSLGVDKRVVVDRKKISDKSKDRIIGSTRERTIHFEINVRNQNLTDIEMTLKDQVPVAGADDIKVFVEETSGSKYNELTGELEWKLKLKAGESKKINFSYTIKYDKNKTVISE